MKYTMLFIPLLAAAALLALPSGSQAAHHLPEEIPLVDTTVSPTAVPLAGAAGGDVVLATWGWRPRYHYPYYPRYYSYGHRPYYYPRYYHSYPYSYRPYYRYYNPHRYVIPRRGFSFRFGW